jgi:dTDP-4-dehydrorhamnose 3,5-epimerase-like enzyme
MTRIRTKDANGNVNGWLLPLWNIHEQDWRPTQVYLTAVSPGGAKGPHLHKLRTGRFVCISGEVEIRMRDPEGYYCTDHTGEATHHPCIIVPAGWAAEIRNIGDKEALVLNFPDRAWRPDDQDEWPVENWSADA